MIDIEALRNWALTVALAALAGGIVRLLTPKGSVEKAVRTVVAVFLLCAFLSPLFSRRSAGFDWILPEPAEPPTIASFNAELSRQVQAAVEAELSQRMTRVLGERGIEISPGQILLRTDILSDGSIEIVTAEVAVPAGTNTAGLAAQLKTATELDVKITKE